MVSTKRVFTYFNYGTQTPQLQMYNRVITVEKGVAITYKPFHDLDVYEWILSESVSICDKMLHIACEGPRSIYVYNCEDNTASRPFYHYNWNS